MELVNEYKKKHENIKHLFKKCILYNYLLMQPKCALNNKIFSL